MCGILAYKSLEKNVSLDAFNIARDTLSHRGPDGSGTEILEDGKIALGHRRLSFLDLSEKGKQPMCNANKTIWITLNGEIYNYLEIKKELLNDFKFTSETDTEVLIYAYQKWGIFKTLQKIKGMFAFVLYDIEKKKMYAARDRFGIKPLYYYSSLDTIILASELKAILTYPGINASLSMNAVCDYLTYRYVPSPKSIWKEVKKIPPATYLEIDSNNRSQSFTYWFLEASEKVVDEQELVSEIGEMLQNSVAIHARSDVPVGSFLSGGYDSSAIAYYMKNLGFNPEVFSIGFDNWDSSEDTYAKIVADTLGLNLHTKIANSGSLQLINVMPDVYDEPIADISIIPTYMVSQLASLNVKAVMSGEGADELFVGYWWQKAFQRNCFKKKIETLSLRLGSKHTNTLDFYFIANAMGAFDNAELKKLLHPSYHNDIPEDSYWWYRKNFIPHWSDKKMIQYLDIKCFMGELVLTKIDRASMAHSLEVRVPFLDHELFEKIFSLNENIYFKKNTTKYLLHEQIKSVLPKQILQRKKQGFVGPDTYYMNTDWYKNELDKSKLVRDGIINRSYIDNLLQLKYDWKLWKLLILEKWYQRWVG